MSTVTPRIYVASLSDYNNGNLHGVWIDDLSDAETIQDEVNAMLRASKYPNVTTECPACGGYRTAFDADDATLANPHPCPECKGVGEVPSAEEWAIHDHEGLGNIDEFESFERIAELAALVEEHGDAFLAYAEHNGSRFIFNNH